MSAYVVDKHHIDALIHAGLVLPRPYGPLFWKDRGGLTQRLTAETVGRVGAMLWAENQRSVNWRYNEDEIEMAYEYQPMLGTPDPIVVLSALACYEYQSCETPDWTDTEANQFCHALRLAAIRKLPGYNDAPWEITDRHAFQAASMR